jgi:hypothetical protein
MVLRIVRHHIYLFINACIQVICGLIKILSLTLYLPSWEFTFMLWFQRKELERVIRSREKK